MHFGGQFLESRSGIFMLDFYVALVLFTCAYLSRLSTTRQDVLLPVGIQVLIVPTSYYLQVHDRCIPTVPTLIQVAEASIMKQVSQEDGLK